MIVYQVGGRYDDIRLRDKVLAVGIVTLIVIVPVVTILIVHYFK